MMAVRPKPVISHNHRGTFIGYLSPAARRPRRCTLDYPGCTDDRSTGPLSGSVADRRLAALLGLEQGRRVRGVAQVHALAPLVTALGQPAPPAGREPLVQPQEADREPEADDPLEREEPERVRRERRGAPDVPADGQLVQQPGQGEADQP